MKRAIIIIALALGGCIGIAAAQIFIQPVQLQDVQSNGSNLGYFHSTPTITKWNILTGTKQSGRVLSIGVQSAVQDPDLGLVESPNGVEIGTLTARPTCAAGIRGTYFTQFTANNGGNPDGGVKDLTYQCCKAAAGTYSWVAGFCQ